MLERWLVWNFSSDFFFLHFIACCVRINNKSSPIEIVGHAVCFGHVSHNVLFLIYCCLICCFSRYLSPFIQYIQLAVVRLNQLNMYEFQFAGQFLISILLHLFFKMFSVFQHSPAAQRWWWTSRIKIIKINIDLPDSLECRPCCRHCAIVGRMRFSGDSVSIKYSVTSKLMRTHNGPSENE